MPNWPLPPVRDLTCGDSWSTYDESVLKLSKFHSEEYPHAWDTLYSYNHQQNSPGWVIFLQLARRAALPARCSMYISFLWGEGGGGPLPRQAQPSPKSDSKMASCFFLILILRRQPNVGIDLSIMVQYKSTYLIKK
jgi:hypothetical protein